MKQRLYDFIPVKHLCVGMSLCGIVAGTQTAQASPVFGQSSGLEHLSPSIYQQSTKQISGIVKDQAGIPVIGANVIVKGTTNGVITGLDGDFLLEVPENATLEISYIGYMTQSIPINGKTTFNIILEEDTQKLDEVVVLGYGAGQRKQDLSASVGVLNNTEDLVARPVTSTESMLQGQLAGVTVQANGGDPTATPSIVIRGQGSQNGDNVLWVVDGVPGAPIASMNDIETIVVLKDAASAAIYGAQSGAGGVILVTTKKAKEGKKYGENEKDDISIRVITDHIRATVFMASDGILPSNEGRGYVLRRLLRRAARHGKLLGVNRPFLYEVVDTVVHENEGHYPELRERQAYITKVIRTEEENFAKTIDGGMKIFTELLNAHKEKGETVFSGADAFKLYDTYGFPIDLTVEMVEDEGMTLDRKAFDHEMQEQKTRAREARKALGDLGWAGVEFGKDIPSTEFVGYDHDSVDDAKVVALVVEGEQAEAMMSGVEGIIVLDKTPFYAEMGGQIGDTGVIRCGEAVFEVTDVQKNKGGKFMHTGKVIHGSFQLGDTVTASIDVERRMAIRRGHTATHLLDAALKAVLGDHVHQAGSLVEPDRLRFDFTHFESITPEQLLAVDTFVNDAILRGIPVVTEVLPIEEAKKKGAVAMFGEKYGDVVRVVEMGEVSMEFCGGTHLDNTAKVGLFRIKSEGSVASGVRRIEAITGKQTLEELRSGQEKLIRAAQLLKTTSNELESRIGGMLSEMKEIKSQLEKFKEQASLGEARTFLTSAKEVKGLKLVTAQRDGMDANALRKLGDFLRDKEPKIVGVLASVNEGKVTLLAVCGKEAVASGVKAGDIIKAIAPICGGKGGGKPDSAMGGGTEVSKVDDALAAVDDLILSKLG